MTEIYIISAARTAMGAFQGAFSNLSAPQLAANTLQACLARAALPAVSDVDEVILGCVLPAGLKQAPARQAMRLAALPDHIPATTINKVCGSGMKAIMMASDAIKAGSAQLIFAGGMESMSNAPYILAKARAGYRMGHGEIKDHMFLEGLEDAETGRSMGFFAQQMADAKGYSREQMDQYAIRSLQRAQTAIAAGYFQAEICPVVVSSRQTERLITEDEQPSKANVEKIPTLKPAFAIDGSITAANASSISDGASALLIASQQYVLEHGLVPLAKIVAYSSHAQHPAAFTTAPIAAIEKLLQQTGWDKDHVDLWEINEAFAMVSMAAIEALALDAEKVNIHGGACALGHPLGSSGSRIVVSLIYALQRLSKRRGVAAICIGGGEATAMAIELL